MSGLFEFHLELAGGEVDLAAIVDKPGVLKIGGIEAPRFISGVISSFEYVGQSRPGSRTCTPAHSTSEGRSCRPESRQS